MGGARAVVFDVGHVLYDWDPRYLYEKLIDDPVRLDWFLAHVVTRDWHFQHDEGRAFTDTSAELIAAYPDEADLIRQFGPRFGETIPGPVPGMPEIVATLDAARVPLYAITNFSAEFWAPFRRQEAALFDRFRDILVSGEARLAKPDPAIFDLAIRRFAIDPQAALFIDDRADNVAAAEAAGFIGHMFEGAEGLRARLAELGLIQPA